MRDILAERLLGAVMEWTPEELARERPDLQAMAAYKYDEYQQFAPGMRFVESLATWLKQFRTAEDRGVAYDFVKRKLIFCSATEMNHLVAMAYPDLIRPQLLRRVARSGGYEEWRVSRAASSVEFRVFRRRTLFLGLSDGARLDAFRRYNHSELSHEQVWQTYEIPDQRVDDLIDRLTSDLTEILDAAPVLGERTFTTVILLDDFSASGISYIRKEDDGTFSGKIAKFHEELVDAESPISRIVERSNLEVMVVLYMATSQALDYLSALAEELWEPLGVRSSVLAVYPLGPEIRVQPGDGNRVGQLLENYYDPSIEDEFTQKGGTDLKFGFAGCGLPVVLNHNTPNNSIYILWAEPPSGGALRPLFPRVSRHRRAS